jgi:hypothetical protein
VPYGVTAAMGLSPTALVESRTQVAGVRMAQIIEGLEGVPPGLARPAGQVIAASSAAPASKDRLHHLRHSAKCSSRPQFTFPAPPTGLPPPR